MKNKNSLILILAGTVAALAIILSGCSTEDPWSPEPGRPLVLEMVSGPDADTVAYGADITYTWTSRGGVGEVQYQYRVGSGDWSALSNITTVQLADRIADGEFSVRAQDDAGNLETVSRLYYVGTAAGADTTPPTVWIESSPTEGSFIATGSSITFSWNGEDDVDGDNLLYWWTFNATESDTSASRSVTFADVAAADPADFSVWAIDQSGNESDPAEVSFTIQDATILYVDDFRWYTAAGDIDLVKERDQKQFYRNALQGYAFAEWDVAADSVPTAAEMIPYNVIVWCSDSDIGANDYTWNDTGLLEDMEAYLTAGGKLLLTGPWTIGDILGYPVDPYNYVPDTSFVYEWLGVDTMHTEIDTTWWWDNTPFDTLVAFPDSTIVDTSDVISWDYWHDFTWAIGEENSLFDLPDSMKIDVAKNGEQLDYAIETPFLRNDPANGITTEVLFRWGLDVNGDITAPYGSPIGHVVSFTGVRQIAILNFDTYSLPLPGVRQTFQAILTKFGE